jgi:hypothetical protein
MKNWTIQGLRFDMSPTPLNYIRSRQSHYFFCKKTDPTLTPDLYLSNLTDEISHETAKLTTVNKKSLTLALFKRILNNPNQKKALSHLFAKEDLTESEISVFLNSLSDNSKGSETSNGNSSDKPGNIDLPVRTYLIASHIYLELHHNELHYESLIRDTSAMEEFIKTTFRADHLSKRLAEMKNFNYKNILKLKNNSAATGQLKPQFKQISSNPEIFGEDVSRFASNVLSESFDI